jgi:hypothetical protein
MFHPPGNPNFPAYIDMLFIAALFSLLSLGVFASVSASAGQA